MRVELECWHGLNSCTAPSGSFVMLTGGSLCVWRKKINWGDFLSILTVGFVLCSGFKLFLRSSQAQNQLEIWRVPTAEKWHDWQWNGFPNFTLVLVRKAFNFVSVRSCIDRQMGKNRLFSSMRICNDVQLINRVLVCVCVHTVCMHI